MLIICNFKCELLVKPKHFKSQYYVEWKCIYLISLWFPSMCHSHKGPGTLYDLLGDICNQCNATPSGLIRFNPERTLSSDPLWLTNRTRQTKPPWCKLQQFKNKSLLLLSQPNPSAQLLKQNQGHFISTWKNLVH